MLRTLTADLCRVMAKWRLGQSEWWHDAARWIETGQRWEEIRAARR